MAPLTLAIETSNPASTRGGVALGRVDESTNDLLDIEHLRDTGRHNDDLMPAIERIMARAGIKPAQLERIAVSAGPGGFTSVRIAVVTAKMIAEATGAGCVAIPSAHVVAARTACDGRRFAVGLAGKGDTAHVTVFDATGLPTGEGAIVDADGLGALSIDLLIADRHLPESMRRRCAVLNVEIIEPVLDPVACLEISARYPDVPPGELLPIYPREPEAVRIWRERHAL